MTPYPSYRARAIIAARTRILTDDLAWSGPFRVFGRKSYDADVASDWETRKVRVATGVTLPYVAHGDPAGAPVILLHAWGESRRSFDRLIPSLSSTIHALVPDQRGHGDADKPEVGYALADFAADIEAFMDALGLVSAALLGSSSGGYVAQQLAVKSPDRVSCLVLVGAPRSLQDRTSFADEVVRLVDPVDDVWVRDCLEWFPRFHDVPDWYIDDRVVDGARVPARVWRDSLTGLLTADPPTETGTINAPTLIICGDRDELIPVEEEQALSTAIPGSRLVVYEHTGHLVLWEQPDRVAQDASDFIADMPIQRA